MITVLYDDETMEPITVFSLPEWAHKRLRIGQKIHFPIYDPMPSSSFIDYSTSVLPTVIDLKTVTVWFETFHRNGIEVPMCFTRDGENALKLKSVFFPGENVAVQRSYQEAFTKGLMAALR